MSHERPSAWVRSTEITKHENGLDQPKKVSSSRKHKLTGIFEQTARSNHSKGSLEELTEVRFGYGELEAAILES